MRIIFKLGIIVLFLIGCTSSQNDSEKSNAEEEQNALEETTKYEQKKTIDQREIPEPKSKEEKLTEAELWKKYRDAKQEVKKAEKNKDYPAQLENLLKAAEYSGKLKRYDIQAWQFNNSGFVLIKQFKEKTNYTKIMQKLNSLKTKKKIDAYRITAKAELEKEKQLLTRAKKYLLKAQKVDNKLESSSRTKTIESNMQFVNEVLNFLQS